MKLRSNSADEDVAISLTPLIDVVFILLIFFMLASSFLDWRQVKVQALSGAKTSLPVQSKVKPVVIIVKADGGLQVQGQPVEPTNLTLVLLDHATDEGEVKFLIKPEAGVPIQKTMDVIGLLRAADLNNFSLVE